MRLVGGTAAPPIDRATCTDPLTRDGLASWTAAVIDVYTGGMFV
jgi:hypothetical protein